MTKKLEDLPKDELRDMLGLLSEADKEALVKGHQEATKQLPSGKTEEEIFSTKYRGPSERCLTLFGEKLKELMGVNSPVLFIPFESLYSEYRLIQDSDDPYATPYNRPQLLEHTRRFVSHNKIHWKERSRRLSNTVNVRGPFGHFDANITGWAHRTVGTNVPADKVYPANWFYDRKTAVYKNGVVHLSNTATSNSV